MDLTSVVYENIELLALVQKLGRGCPYRRERVDIHLQKTKFTIATHQFDILQNSSRFLGIADCHIDICSRSVERFSSLDTLSTCEL